MLISLCDKSTVEKGCSQMARAGIWEYKHTDRSETSGTPTEAVSRLVKNSSILMVHETSRKMHSLNNNHGEEYFKVNSLITNFFFSLNVPLGPGTAKKANTATKQEYWKTGWGADVKGGKER